MPEELDIVDHLIEQLNKGKFDAEDQLPSENELAHLFHVPRITVRRAYERLQELGYIYTKQGKGRFVKDRHQNIPIVLFTYENFSKRMIKLGYNYESKNIFCEPIEYNDKVYRALQVKDNKRVFKVGRLRIVDHVPIALHISYVSEDMFEDIEQQGSGITSMFDFYQNKGYTDLQSEQIMLRMTYANKYEREWFACSGLIPLLIVESQCIDYRSNQTVEYSKILYRGDYFTYSVEGG